jgi:DNA-binding CsgD family transcriptional regulator
MEGTTLTAVAVAETHIIERPRLTAILDASNARVLMLVAPAGYGKTTLARQWLRDKPHVWYQAAAASADPVVLATHLQRLFDAGDDGRTTIRDLIAADPTVAEDPRALAKAVVGRPGGRSPGILAVDEYRFIADSPLADQLLREVLRQDPCRLILTTRIRPSSMASREAVYGDTFELSAVDLAMTEKETGSVLRQTPQADRIAASAAGWPALIGLAARAGSSSPLPELTPNLAYEFLADELLRDAPPALENLVAEVALAPSREAKARTEHPQLVRDAVARGLLQRDGGRITVHPVLADLVKKRLCNRPEGVATISQMIASLLDEEAWDDAYALIDEFDRADFLLRLLEAGPVLLKDGRFETTQRWQKTAERLAHHSALTEFLRADEALRRGAYMDAMRMGAQAASRSTRRPVRGKSLLVAGRAAKSSGLVAEATRFFDLAARAASTDEDLLEAMLGRAMTIIDFELDEDDHLDEVQQKVSRDPEAALRVATVRIYKAGYTGPLSKALRVVEDTQQLFHVVTAPWPRSAFLGIHALLLLLSADYAFAQRLASAALIEARRAHFEFAIQQIEILRAQAEVGEGNFSAAARRLRLLGARARRGEDAHFLAAIDALRIRFLISRGLADEAVADLSALDHGIRSRAAAGELLASIALAVACSGDASGALQRCAEVKRMTRWIEARTLADAAEAVALTTPRTTAPAKKLIERARTTGNVDACVTALRGSSALRAAFRIVAEEPSRQGLFARFALSIVDPASRRIGHTPVSGLSAREREILELLKQGLTNRQIARALFISEATVKVHLRHAFKKLGVRTRTEAALLSRDLDETRVARASDGNT